MSTAIAKRKEQEIVEAKPPNLTASLLPMLREILVNPQISPERVTQTLDFYERMDRIQGKKEFDAAIADAKAEFEPIVKRHLVNRGAGGNYKHEDLADIDGAVRPAMSKYGLNYRYRASSNPNEPIRVTCVVTHRQGYSEETTLSAGADASGGKNSIQAIGSTVTYLQRYTLRLALGLAASRDDDGQAASLNAQLITDEQAEQIKSLIVDTNSDIGRFCAYFKIKAIGDLPAGTFERAMAALKKKASA